MIVIGFTVSGFIRVEIEGQEILVPDTTREMPKYARGADGDIMFDDGKPVVETDGEGTPLTIRVSDNTLRQDILDWQAAGNTIPPCVPAQIDPLTLPLPRLVFWLVAAQTSVSKWSVRDRIAAMPEGLEKFEAIAWFEEAEQYRRNDPILIEQSAAEGITPEQLDALWLWALQTYDLLPPAS